MPRRRKGRERKGRWRTEKTVQLFSDYFYIILNVMYKYTRKLQILKFCKLLPFKVYYLQNY
jgi:hypothetical protein